jgi:hypothetical protein
LWGILGGIRNEGILGIKKAFSTGQKGFSSQMEQIQRIFTDFFDF